MIDIIVFFVAFVIFALVSWVFMSARDKKYINVGITDANGDRRIVRIAKGRDPEVDELIKRVRKVKAAHS
jgi:parvulin-like peptidyl-prolyl isomerase